MSQESKKYETCPECTALYDAGEYKECLSCHVPLRPATDKEVLDFYRNA